MCLIALASCIDRLYTNGFNINTVNIITINMKFKTYIDDQEPLWGRW